MALTAKRETSAPKISYSHDDIMRRRTDRVTGVPRYAYCLFVERRNVCGKIESLVPCDQRRRRVAGASSITLSDHNLRLIDGRFI